MLTADPNFFKWQMADFVAAHGEVVWEAYSGVKSKFWLRRSHSESMDYIMQEEDIVEFKIGS